MFSKYYFPLRGIRTPGRSGWFQILSREYTHEATSLFSYKVMADSLPWNVACQAFLFFTISQTELKFTPTESVMPPNHLILSFSCPLLLLLSITPSIKVLHLASKSKKIIKDYWSHDRKTQERTEGFTDHGTTDVCQFISVHFSRSVVSNSLQPHGLQHASLPCPSPTPRVCSNSRPLSQWCHRTISTSVVPFSSCLQSFPASGSFLMSQFFTSSGQSIGASASASFLPMNIQG